jgi:hypothetical protein
MCKSVVVNQLKAFNGSLVITALCFSLVALTLSYITPSFWMMLVDYNIRTKSQLYFATSAAYMDSLPSWVASAYRFESYLLLALLIWIILNLIHWIIIILYPLWLSHQKEKYPLSY